MVDPPHCSSQQLSWRGSAVKHFNQRGLIEAEVTAGWNVLPYGRCLNRRWAFGHMGGVQMYVDIWMYRGVWTSKGMQVSKCMEASEHMGVPKHMGASKCIGVSKHKGCSNIWGMPKGMGESKCMGASKHMRGIWRYRRHPNTGGWGVQM